MLRIGLSAAAAAALALQPIGIAAAQERGDDAIPIDSDDIAGVVRSAQGAEAGVWVIAETDDLETKFRKIVVTDDEGRYLLPDLPAATYDIWVRGYGLVDSEKVEGRPGAILPLAATVAPDAQAAAQYYPASYWYSLLPLPPESEFPGTGVAGNGIGEGMRSQHYWINQVKTGCEVCHQLGNLATREFPPGLGEFESSFDAWDHRTQVGQDAPSMAGALAPLGRERGLELFAEWTDRIAAGALPPAPPRPEGLERNLVLTLWEWGGPATFAHDELSTDKRNPTANANGPIYGVDWGNDGFLTLDPNTHVATEVRLPVLDPDTPVGKPQSMPRPSPYWGDELYWFDQAIPNHAAMDSRGRVWMSGRFRKPEDQPDFCADHASAALAPLSWSFRQVQYFDPSTQEFHQADICFDTHHVQFAEGEDDRLYGNGVISGTIGWIDTRLLDETGDLAQAQGWCRPYYDIDGDGRVDPSVDRLMFESFLATPGAGALFGVPSDGEPAVIEGQAEAGGPVIGTSLLYSVIAHPTDGSVWGAMPGPMPGRIVRIDPETCIGEAYEPPFDTPADDVEGYTPRGIDVDSNGVIWTALAGSGHLASFDRSKCEDLGGPAAMTGRHCPEGWTLHRTPGPSFEEGPEEISVDFHYFNFVDRHNTLGLGPDIPFANGTTSDSLLALLPSGEWLTLRVPYPLGFYQRGMDGRIDDPEGGWKGRAMYADFGQNAVWHIEGGLGTRSSVVRFQMRPDPLAR